MLNNVIGYKMTVELNDKEFITYNHRLSWQYTKRANCLLSMLMWVCVIMLMLSISKFSFTACLVWIKDKWCVKSIRHVCQKYKSDGDCYLKRTLISFLLDDIFCVFSITMIIIASWSSMKDKSIHPNSERYNLTMLI